MGSVDEEHKDGNGSFSYWLLVILLSIPLAVLKAIGNMIDFVLQIVDFFSHSYGEWLDKIEDKIAKKYW